MTVTREQGLLVESSVSPNESGDQSHVQPYRQVDVTREVDGTISATTDAVAEEVPVGLQYNGVPQAVMMATPTDIEDLAVGFSITEGIVSRVGEIRAIDLRRLKDGFEVNLSIPADKFAALLQRQRNLTGRTGCGVCGLATVDAVLRVTNKVHSSVQVDSGAIYSALEALYQRQSLNRVVGSVHGAAWMSGSNVSDAAFFVREDVGRHNALDKLIGALLRQKVDIDQGYFVISSRASYEMVLKAATVGASLLIAVSAPTALAIDLANDCGMTLVGFARKHSHVVYTHPHRVSS